jgi:hypothetical protein
MVRHLSVGLLIVARVLVASPAQPTFHEDIQPILAKHCQTCHTRGQVAPMPLVTYADTKPFAAKIKELVAAKKMPPVIGTPHYTVLTRGEGLTQTEVNTLTKWVDGGAPEGAAGRGKQAPAERDGKK